MPIIAKCRFCGADAKEWRIRSPDGGVFLQCKTQGCCTAPARDTHDEAIVCWNAMHGVTQDYPDSDNQQTTPEEHYSAGRFKLLEIDDD